jgi:hypothetical protein
MFGAEAIVSHRTHSATSLGYNHVLFILSGHDLFGSLLVTILTSRVSLYIVTEREMCPWAISKYFGDLVSNTSA